MKRPRSINKCSGAWCHGFDAGKAEGFLACGASAPLWTGPLDGPPPELGEIIAVLGADSLGCPSESGAESPHSMEEVVIVRCGPSAARVKGHSAFKSNQDRSFTEKSSRQVEGGTLLCEESGE